MLFGVASAFMLIENNGSGNDKLTGCSVKEFSDVKGEIHDVINGKMQNVEAIKIPADKTTALRKGSIHLMFYRFPDKLEDEMTLVLKFKKTGTIEVRVSMDKLKVKH
jgi:copper(I)-binding protein